MDEFCQCPAFGSKTYAATYLGKLAAVVIPAIPAPLFSRYNVSIILGLGSC